MKNKTMSSQLVADPIAITTTLSEFPVLKNLVEKFAPSSDSEIGVSYVVAEGFASLETASIESDISGDMVLSDSRDLVHLSFNTSFYFTCIKKLDDRFRLAWGVSLS